MRVFKIILVFFTTLILSVIAIPLAFWMPFLILPAIACAGLIGPMVYFGLGFGQASEADKPIRVTIVEDDPEIAVLLKRSLDQKGIESQWITGEKTTEKMLKLKDLGVVILDWKLAKDRSAREFLKVQRRRLRLWIFLCQNPYP